MGFRERHGYLAAVPLKWEDAPKSLRNRLVQLIRIWAEESRNSGNDRQVCDLYGSVSFELGVEMFPPAMQLSSSAVSQLRDLIVARSWAEVYEIAEFFARYAGDRSINESINSALQRDNIGWRLGDDLRLTRLEQDPSARVAVAQASNALEDPRLVDVREHYSKALSLFNSLREPDLENAIKEAILCLEQVGRIVAGLPKATLGEVADRLGGTVVPKPLDSVLRALHGYASQNWIRHSGGKVSFEEAQFVILTASNCIAYLASKLPEPPGATAREPVART